MSEKIGRAAAARTSGVKIMGTVKVVTKMSWHPIITRDTSVSPTGSEQNQK